MAVRSRFWRTVSAPSSADGAVANTGSGVISVGDVNATILRTRAACRETHGAQTVPPAYQGNSHSPRALQVVIHREDTPPRDQWWDGRGDVDPVIFHPLVWGSPVYVVADLAHGRPEEVWTMGDLAGGVADSHGQRHFPGQTAIVVSWYAGPAIGGQSFADPLVTVAVWIRCLIEAEFPA